MTEAQAKPVYNRVALIGLGLIASSMFWAMKRAGAAGEVTGYARSAETRATVVDLGFCDRVVDTAADAVAGALLPAGGAWAEAVRWQVGLPGA